MGDCDYDESLGDLPVHEDRIDLPRGYAVRRSLLALNCYKLANHRLTDRESDSFLQKNIHLPLTN
jgi:hypothetical protein